MNSGDIKRLLKRPERSFFLFGPRGVGKSTWLRDVFGESLYFDLLDSSLSLELLRNPHALEAMVGDRPAGTWVVLDEVQKIPALLDETHRLMERRRWRFALCGSSARKLRKGAANLLGGRALTLKMEPFSFAELGARFDLRAALEWGLLPMVVNNPDAADILAAYADTYLKEEIKEEGLVRSLPPFVRFLSIAGQMNGQVVNGQNIAREAATPRSTVDNYFSIIEDTLLGCFLSAWQPGLKVRETAHPKFYWTDSGLARAAAGLLNDPVDRLWKGAALETLVFHELRVFNAISRKKRPIAFYRTASGLEIDFVVETRKRRQDTQAGLVGIEVKLADKWNRKWERPLRDLAVQPGIEMERMIGVYTGQRSYRYDGLDVWPVERFLTELHGGNVF